MRARPTHAQRDRDHSERSPLELNTSRPRLGKSLRWWIAKRSTIDALDFDLLRQETDIVGYPILPLVHQLVKMCGDSGRYVHWGATTQDIMDTAVVLQVRDALAIVDADIVELRRILGELAQRYRDTPMAGRTHMQQALPITFGYKVGIWLAMFDRHAERLWQLRPRVLVGQFAGCVLVVR